VRRGWPRCGLVQHPDVLAATAALCRDDVQRALVGDAGEAARHDAVAVGGGDRVDADRQRAARKRRRGRAAPHRRLRQRDVLLGDEGIRPRLQTLDQPLSRGGVELVPEHRLEALVRIRGLDDEAIEVGQHVGQRRSFAAPPGRHGRQAQRFAEQSRAQAGHEAEPAGRLEHAAAERVGERDAPRAHHGQQPCHAERGVAAQLERIAVVVVEAPQDRVHAAQAASSVFSQTVIAADGEVAALDQRKPR
jgi:hypothetical protein